MDTLHTAYRFNPGDFPAALVDDCDPAERARLLGLLEAAAVSWDDRERRGKFTVRFNSGDGVVREVVVGEQD